MNRFKYHSTRSFLFSILIVLTVSDHLTAQYPSIYSLFPKSIGDLTHVHDYDDKYGDSFGEHIVTKQYRVPNWERDDLWISLTISEFKPGEIINDLNAQIQKAKELGYPYHFVDDWIVAFYDAVSDDEFMAYNSPKGIFSIGVSIHNPSSSKEGQKYADIAYNYILPKIPDPETTDTIDKTTGLSSNDVSGATSEDKTNIRTKSEYDIKREKAYKDYEDERDIYITAESTKMEALKTLYDEGEKAAENSNFSISSNVQIIPPQKKLAIYREVDHEFGITVKNNSNYDISKVKITIYANTRKGKEKLDSRKISFVQKNNSGSTIFKISHRKLWSLLGDFIALGNALEIIADYKIKWNKSYFSSESTTEIWIEAINPSEKGTDIYTDSSVELPPVGSIQLVDERNQILSDNEIIAGNTTFIKFSLSKDNRGSGDYLVSYDKPTFSVKPDDALFSKGMDNLNIVNPSSQNLSKKKFEKQRKYSGEFLSDEITFYGYIKFPNVKNDQEVKVKFPIKYTYESNLANKEKYWNTTMSTARFRIVPPRAESDLSDILECNVREVYQENQFVYGLTLPGGQIATYSGDIVWVEPTDKWWNDDYKDWEKANKKLLDGEGYDDKLEKSGEILVGEVLGEYESNVWGTVSTVFSMNKIVEAQTEDEIIGETIKVIAGTVVPFSSVMIPVIEKANVWAKRNKKEEEILSAGINKGATDKFKRGTLFRNKNEDFGLRIFYKIIDNKMYAIKLGPSNI